MLKAQIASIIVKYKNIGPQPKELLTMGFLVGPVGAFSHVSFPFVLTK